MKKSARTLITGLMIFSIISFPFLIYGQDSPEIIPPSPTASALGEYGNTPISLSTGTTNINIPIWEVKGRQLNLPISLSYRSSGIKVDEHGSHVGLGWTLNAGGMITTIIKDAQDRGVNDNGMIPYRAGWPLADFKWGDLVEYAIELDNTYDAYDKQPDHYYYNFAGYSGQFIFDDAGNPMVSPNVNFKIERTAAGYISKIIDEKGVIYTFGISERNDSYFTGWYLTKIESSDLTEWISFEYSSESIRYLINKREARLVGYNTISTYLSEPWYRIEVNTAYRLNRITTSFGETIDFNPGETRQDFHNNLGVDDENLPKNIEEIEINYWGACVKKITLDFDLIESSNPGYIDPAWQDSFNQDVEWANKRTYLAAIEENTCDSEEIKVYTFDYYGRTTDNQDSLPSKISFAQDHWGYFNGETSNTSYRPPFAGEIPDISGTLHFNSISGADRASSFPEMRYGTLKSITYPTGGTTEFIFEQHKNITAPSLPSQAGGYDSNAGGLRIKEINDKINDNIVRSRKYAYYSGHYADYPNYGGDDLVYRTDLEGNYFEDVLHHFKHPTFQSAGPGDESPGTDERQYYKIGSSHPNTLGTTNGYHLNYGLVVETEAGNGRTQYSFTTADTYGDQPNLTVDYARRSADCPLCLPTGGDYNANAFEWPYTVRTSLSWMRGLPTRVAYYSNDNELIKGVNYLYEYRDLKGVKRKLRLNDSNELEHYLDTSNPSSMYGLKMVKTSFDDEESTPHPSDCGICVDTPEETWYYNTYKIGIGVALLSQETLYEDGVTITKNHTYNDQNQIVSTTFTNSKDESVVTLNKYPQDFATAGNIYSKMEDANILAPLIETETTVDGSVTFQIKNNYDDWGNGFYLPEIVQASNGSIALEDRVHYHDYDDKGNLLEVSNADNLHTVYIWGYNQVLPIAKIENAAYTNVYRYVNDLQNLSDIDDDTCLDSEPCDEKNLRAALNNLRNLSSLSNAQITTYTYDPLVGMTSVTDANQITTYYEYDSFNRLKCVRDTDGNIISQTEYHYESQSD